MHVVEKSQQGKEGENNALSFFLCVCHPIIIMVVLLLLLVVLLQFVCFDDMPEYFLPEREQKKFCRIFYGVCACLNNM